MRVVALCAALASAFFCTSALAQVGVGTPDCHTQGTLYRMANHCPPEAIAAARQQEYLAEHAQPLHRHHRHHRAVLAH
jgi:hypothetical protein